jgi:hypothetical protein
VNFGKLHRRDAEERGEAQRRIFEIASLGWPIETERGREEGSAPRGSVFFVYFSAFLRVLCVSAVKDLAVFHFEA